MKSNMLICSCAFLLLLSCISSRGQKAYEAELEKGVRLQDQGKSTEAVQVLTTFLSTHPSLAAEQKGMALSALGAAYQEIGNDEQARRSYDQAVSILQNQANGKQQYAEALDNLGSLELHMGNLNESEKLRKHAYSVYTELESRSGLCRAANNLAVIAFNEGKLQKAEVYLNEAFLQATADSGVTEDDLASMYNLRGRLAESHKDFATAVASHRKALHLWLVYYSPDYYKVALGYAALGQAEAGAGNLKQALADLEHATALEKSDTSKVNGGLFLYTSMVYAHVLKLSGDGRQAAVIEADARAKLAQSKGANNTVSAAGLSLR